MCPSRQVPLIDFGSRQASIVTSSIQIIALLSVSGVSKRFRGLIAVDALSFAVHRQDRTATASMDAHPIKFAAVGN